MVASLDLTLRQLEYAVAVAETLGFHRAAERCHVSQPTLSAQVAQLEAALGVQLFERDRRHVIVTPAGARLVERARRVLLEAQDLAAAAVRARDPLAGELRVGVIPTVAPYLLPEVTPLLSERYPRLRPVFLEAKTSEVVAGLDAGTLDAGLLALEADLGPCAHAEVRKDPFVVALPKGHPLARRARVGLADLAAETVLLLEEGHCLRAQALALCAKGGAREAAFRATSLATLAQMVSSGAGVTLLPSLAVEVENRRGQLELRPIDPPAPFRTIALVFRPSSPLAGPLRELAATLRRAPPAKGRAGAAPEALAPPEPPEPRPAARRPRGAGPKARVGRAT
ncbi:MAG TPA: LysR substrate-binding domain-containing protein [Polyangiaceae bacterium]|nr:LysR substrate-binding domain-containing protein [Polyangiaceae bacterium]